MKYKPVLGGVRMGLPKGDLYEGAIKIMKEAGYSLFDPASVIGTGRQIPQPLTGNEPSREVPPFAYIRDNKKGGGFDPNRGLRDIEEIDAAGDVVVLVRPQEFRNLMVNEKKIDVGVVGYDLEINYAELDPLELNGAIHNPALRTGIMQEDLSRCSYTPLLCAEYKPTGHVLFVRRGGGIRCLDDLKNGKRREGISEFSHMSRQYAYKNGLNVGFARRDAFGGVDDQVSAGLYDVGQDLLETCKKLEKYAFKVTLVRNGDGKVVIVSFSKPWIVANNEAINNNGNKIYELSDRLACGVRRAKRKGPTRNLFAERYMDFLKNKWDSIDIGLGFG